jgi:hypothetical protein
LGDDESDSRKSARIRNPARVAETIIVYGFIMSQKDPSEREIAVKNS